MLTQTEFINSADLARRLGVSRATICRWRHAGFLPQPCYADAGVTLWASDSIERWEEAGRPWSDEALAREHVRHKGAAWLNRQVEPEAHGAPETAEHARLVEEAERILNECDRLVQRLETAAVADRFTSLRQAIDEILGRGLT